MAVPEKRQGRFFRSHGRTSKGFADASSQATFSHYNRRVTLGLASLVVSVCRCCASAHQEEFVSTTTPDRHPQKVWNAAPLVFVGRTASTTQLLRDVACAEAARVASGLQRTGPRSVALVRREAQFSRQRLEKEALVTEKFLRRVGNFFNPTSAEEVSTIDPEVIESRILSTRLAEQKLRGLRLSVLVEDEDGEPIRRSAPVDVIQRLAEQSLAIFTSTDEEVLRDVLLSMRISAREFNDKNILIVPVLLSPDCTQIQELSTKFLSSKLMNQREVALAGFSSQEDSRGWGDLLSSEFAGAEGQDLVEEAKQQGLAVLVASSGQIVRRGLGRPDWKIIFDDLGL